MYPKGFKKLIDNFASLPSVGPKMAERLVLYMFKQDKSKIQEFAENMENLKNMRSCKRCFNIAEEELCEICKNSKRNQNQICVVEEPLDIISLEKTGAYQGLYFVLGGNIFQNENDLKINDLLNRIKDEGIEEIIIATNPTTEGDATALYLKRKIQPLGVKITQLARGLTTGGDIEYIDETTLSAALNNRKEI